jgi:hypothetical protein
MIIRPKAGHVQRRPYPDYRDPSSYSGERFAMSDARWTISTAAGVSGRHRTGSTGEFDGG